MEDQHKPQSENEQIEPQVLTHDIPEQKKKLVRQTTIHSGPLPHPETLQKYNEIIPNGAERIMIMAEKQQNHRIEIEKIAISGQVHESKMGQRFAFIMGMTGLSMGFICIIMGQGFYGAVFIGGTLVSLVSVFIIGTRSKNKDLESKRHNHDSKNT